MKKPIILLIAVTLLGSCKGKQQDLSKDISVPVTTSPIQPRSIEKFIDITGTVKPVKEVQLKSEMNGNYSLRVNPSTGRPYSLGDRVLEGSEIIELQDKEYENNIKINSLKLNLDITKQVFDRQQSLYEKGGVTLSELKNAEINFINAQYAYDDAQLRLQKMIVKAPFAGVIIDLPYYTPGTRISSGQSVVSLMSYEKMYMDFNLPEKNISDIQLGQQVLVTSYTLENDTLPGVISELSPAISTETRTFKGKLTIDNPNLLLRPGMFVKADIITASKDSTIVIPKDIILSSNRGKSVYVVDRSNARERRITLGIENQDYVEVLEGLSVNDQLVVKGYETLRNGSKVKVIR
jgi:RND family efflux transporter MFP subunit